MTASLHHFVSSKMKSLRTYALDTATVTVNSYNNYCYSYYPTC